MASFAQVPGVVRDLMLLRRGPQDLPHSESLLGTLALTSVLLGSLLSVRLLGSTDLVAAALGSAASIAVAMAVTFALLRLHQRPARFVQTASALLAVSLPFAVVAAIVVAMASPLPKDKQTLSGIQLLAGAIALALVVWQLLVRGNIFRHALEVPLARGVLLSLSLTFAELVLASLMAQLVPQPT